MDGWTVDRLKTLHRGRHLELVDDEGWEFVRRHGVSGVVAICAITDAGELLLVEQHRKPLGQVVLELPAGLAGDIAGAEDEPLVEAAKRELLEETGYTASEWVDLGKGPASAGLTDETIHFFGARGLVKVGEGGGDASEDITVREVPMEQVHAYLRDSEILVDVKIPGALWMLERA